MIRRTHNAKQRIAEDVARKKSEQDFKRRGERIAEDADKDGIIPRKWQPGDGVPDYGGNG
jgi:hypothetical protein